MNSKRHGFPTVWLVDIGMDVLIGGANFDAASLIHNFYCAGQRECGKGSKNRNRRVSLHSRLVTAACVLPTTLCMHTCQGLTIAAHVTLRRRTFCVAIMNLRILICGIPTIKFNYHLPKTNVKISETLRCHPTLTPQPRIALKSLTRAMLLSFSQGSIGKKASSTQVY